MIEKISDLSTNFYIDKITDTKLVDSTGKEIRFGGGGILLSSANSEDHAVSAYDYIKKFLQKESNYEVSNK